MSTSDTKTVGNSASNNKEDLTSIHNGINSDEARRLRIAEQLHISKDEVMLETDVKKKKGAVKTAANDPEFDIEEKIESKKNISGVLSPSDKKVHDLMEKYHELLENKEDLRMEFESLEKERDDYKERYQNLLLKLSRNFGISLINGELIKNELIPNQNSSILRGKLPGYNRKIIKKTTQTETAVEQMTASDTKELPTNKTKSGVLRGQVRLPKAVPLIKNTREGEAKVNDQEVIRETILEKELGAEETADQNFLAKSTIEDVNLDEEIQAEEPVTTKHDTPAKPYKIEVPDNTAIIEVDGKLQQVTIENQNDKNLKRERAGDLSSIIINWANGNAVNAATYTVSANGKI